MCSFLLLAVCLFLEENHRRGGGSLKETPSPSHLELNNQNTENDNTVTDALDTEVKPFSCDVGRTVPVEVELLAHHIAEADIDSTSNVTADSDTALLLSRDAGMECKGGHGWIKEWIEQLKAVDLISCARRFFVHQWKQCLECCWCCVNPEDHSCQEISHARTNRSSQLSARAWSWKMCRAALRNIKKIMALIADRSVFLSIFLYATLGTLEIITNEVQSMFVLVVQNSIYKHIYLYNLLVIFLQLFPLQMVTDHKHGGYSMDDNEIGVFISIVAVVQLFFQVKENFENDKHVSKVFVYCSHLMVFVDLHNKTAWKQKRDEDIAP